MQREVFLLLFAIAPSALAGEAECSKLAARLDGPEDNFRPPLEAKVIGNGRLPFHSAPSANCQMKGVFVVRGNSLTVYRDYDGWLNVMYIAKDGEDYIGWVPSDRVQIIGQYGRNK